MQIKINVSAEKSELPAVIQVQRKALTKEGLEAMRAEAMTLQAGAKIPVLAVKIEMKGAWTPESRDVSDCYCC
jgi:hypothetical protein